MQFQPDTLADIRRRMDEVKSHSQGGFATNYFLQEIVGRQLFSATTNRTVLFVNDEFDFFRRPIIFSTDLADLAGTA